nr:hypothetical protein BaRGS_024346 [Batillaria attramentaria]
MIEHCTRNARVVKYWFKFKRKPDYYGLNLILPVIMLSVLSVLIFVLPAESGEMMGFSVTLLLTFIVFVQVLASMIPTTSESTSFFEVYVVIVLGFNAFSVALSIFNLAIYHHPEDEAIPDWARRLTAFFQRPCCGSNKSRTTVQHVRPASSHVEGAINRSTATPVVKLNGGKAERDEEDEGITWKVMAAVFDSVLLRVYIVFIVFFTVLFLGLMAGGE